jgi:hypothetical protein
LKFKKELDIQSENDTNLNDLKSLLLEAPIFTEEQIATIEQTRKDIDKWRLKWY